MLGAGEIRIPPKRGNLVGMMLWNVILSSFKSGHLTCILLTTQEGLRKLGTALKPKSLAGYELGSKLLVHLSII